MDGNMRTLPDSAMVCTNAQNILEALLEEPLLKDTSLASAAQLRYLVLKNLAALLADTADADDASAAAAAMRAVQLYGQALLLDDGDAVVWNRMGTLVRFMSRPSCDASGSTSP